MEYVIRRADVAPVLDGAWNASAWSGAETLSIAHFHAKSSAHHPATQARVLYDDGELHVIFRVQDRYVRCVHQQYQDMVCRDSCVEFFVEPKEGKGYLNFEMNCGGALHASYIEDARRTPDGFAKFERLSEECDGLVARYHSMPERVEPEISEPVEWVVQYRVPIAVLERYVGPLGALRGQVWRGNFYKCGDETSHPHWGAWAPVGEPLNFHKPEVFQALRLE